MDFPVSDAPRKTAGDARSADTLLHMNRHTIREAHESSARKRWASAMEACEEPEAQLQGARGSAWAPRVRSVGYCVAEHTDWRARRRRTKVLGAPSTALLISSLGPHRFAADLALRKRSLGRKRGKRRERVVSPSPTKSCSQCPSTRNMAEEAEAPDAAAAPADAAAAAPEGGDAAVAEVKAAAMVEVDDAAVLELLEQARTPQVVEQIWDGFLERQKEYSQMLAKRSGGRRPESPRLFAPRAPEELEAGWGQFLSRMEQTTAISVLPEILSARRTDGSWEYKVRSPRGGAAPSPRGKATNWVDGRHLSASPRVEAGTRRTMESLRATARVRAADQTTFADRVRTVELTYGSRAPRPKEKVRAKAPPKVASRVAGKQAPAPAAAVAAAAAGDATAAGDAAAGDAAAGDAAAATGS